VTITDAVIPVAGLGTRLLPATRSQPKEMLPVLDTPVVQYVVEELARAGIERVLFVTGKRKQAIEDHFDSDGDELVPGVQVLYTRQSAPRGLGDALRHAAGFAAGRPVVVALGDTIIAGPGVVPRLIAAQEAHRADAVLAVEEVAPEDVSRYGIVAVGEPLGDDALEVHDVVEKPVPEAAPSRLAIAARYVLGPDAFAALDATAPDASGEVQLADAIRRVLEDGGRVVAVPLAAGEHRHDVGTVEGYCATFLEFALTDPRLGPRLRARAAALLDDGR
jgi:UTP--glucose-1-phosphate uridylyltransferase